MSNMHTHLDAARKSELAQDPAEHPRRAHPVKTADPVLRALSTAEAAFTRYASHHLRQAGNPGEDAAKRRQQAAENADLAQAMREGIAANYARSYQVPQGWKLVPCEPTREMLDKARENLVRDGEIDPMLKGAYAAMLSATPKLVTAQASPSPDDCGDRLRVALLADGAIKNLTEAVIRNMLETREVFGMLELGLEVSEKVQHACADAWGVKLANAHGAKGGAA